MHLRFLRLSLLVTSALFATAFAGATPTAMMSAAEARQHFANLPQPVAMKAFSDVPSRYEGRIINVAVTVDEHGNAIDVQEATRLPSDLKSRILPVVSKWKFTPARDKAGNAVPLRVIYPLRLVARQLASSSS